MEITEVTRIIRRMRGGSQSCLVEDERGRFLVAKLNGNPQGSRTLINECIGNSLMTKLGISTPRLFLLRLPAELRSNPELSFMVGRDTWSPHEGLHLGSECPINPNEEAIFDFLPSTLLPTGGNITEFGSALVLDKWLNQTDRRQAIFVRDRQSKHSLFRAYFIDNGFAFSGSEWRLDDRETKPVMHSQLATLFDLNRVFEETIEKIESITQHELVATLKQIPDCWFSKWDRDELDKLLLALFRRRARLRELMRLPEVAGPPSAEVEVGNPGLSWRLIAGPSPRLTSSVRRSGNLSQRQTISLKRSEPS